MESLVLCNLVQRFREANALADLLYAVAARLRGRPADPDELSLDLYPSVSQVRRALERRPLALAAAWESWAALPTGRRESLASPAEVLEGAEV